jgi:4-oxalocrotonate tautomerase
MPHIEINHYPKALSDEQRLQLAQGITQLICEHLSVEEGTVSIAMQAVRPSDWAQQVYRPLIKSRGEALIKSPTYSMPNEPL